MADTADAVRRDIAVTRERMASTLSELERKVNLMQMVRDHPWPAVGIAFGTGVVLSRSGRDLGNAVAAGVAARTARSRTSRLIDEVVARLLLGLGAVAETQIDRFLDRLQRAVRGESHDDGARASHTAE